MALLDNAVGLNRSRSAVVFMVKENIPGEIAANPTDANTFGLTTTPVIGQSGNYTDTSEIGAELISMDRVLNYMEYSTFDFEYYAKPGGLVKTDIAASIDNTVTPIPNVAGTVTLTFTVGEVANLGLQVGDTIEITTDDSASNGTYVITGVAGDTVTYQLASVNSGNAITAVQTLSKVTYNFDDTPESDLLARTFGGVKYLSIGDNGDDSGYYAGKTPAAGSYAPVAEANATAAQFYLRNTVETFTVTSRQFTDKSVQMYTATGSLPTNFSVSFAKDGPVSFSSSFQGNRVFYGGTASILNSANVPIAAGATGVNITLTAPKRYASGSVIAGDVAWYHSESSIGMECKLMRGSDSTVFPSDSDAGLVITAVSLDTVTVTNNGTDAADIPGDGTDWYLIPFTPEPCPDTGGLLDQRKVQVFLADAPTTSEAFIKMFDWAPTSPLQLFNSVNALDVTSVSLDFDRSISTPGLTEMTGEEFPPASYIINEPSITGSMTLLLRPKDFQYMNSLREEPRRSVGIRVGLENGRFIEIAIAAAFLEIPTPSDADGATQIDIPFTAIRGVECDDADKFMVRYR